MLKNNQGGKMKYILIAMLFLIGCGGGGIPQELIQPTVNEKIALTLQRYQDTKCLNHCIIEKVESCYTDIETEQERCVKVCPIQYKGFKCTDLYADETGKRNVYWIGAADWQEYIEHHTIISFLKQNVSQLTQLDYLCDHDLILCENHYEVIEVLRDYVINLEE